MLEFIAKYWLEFVFGLITLAISGVAKHYYNLVKDGEKYHKEQEEETQDAKTAAAINEFRKEVKEEIAKNHAKDEERAKSLSALKDWALYFHKRDLLREAARFLEPDHIITYNEFMDFTKSHAVYNGLGGNSEGDQAYDAVKEKYYQQKPQSL